MKEMASHSSILAKEISWTEEPGSHEESDTTEQLSIYPSTYQFSIISVALKKSRRAAHHLSVESVLVFATFFN